MNNIIYEDDNGLRKAGAPSNLHNANATKCYLKHYENYLTLKFFAERGNWDEKRRAQKEIEVCERKLAYWKKHENFNTDAANKGVLALQSMWKE